MTTQLRNVTPGSPQGGVPARFSMRSVLVVAIVFVAVLLIVDKLVLHHENAYEKSADRITRALAANDMRPVERDFNALRRPQLENRAKVGELSDFVNKEGAFEKTREDTPAGSAAGYHHFIASFKGGELSEDLTVDGDGKIADFHIRPLETK